MRLPAVVFAALVLVAVPIVAGASPAYDDLQSLAKDMTFTTARLHPMQATALGIAGHDGQLEVPSEQSRTAEIALIISWQNRLAKIEADNKGAMTLVERDDAALLAAQLTGQLRQFTVYDADRKDYAAAANSVVGAIFTQFQHLPIAGQRGATSADVVRAWGDITSRLSKAPAFIVAANAMVTHPGHLQGI